MKKMKKEDAIHTIVVIVVAFVAVLIMFYSFSSTFNLSENELIGQALSPLKAKSDQSFKSGELPYIIKFPTKIVRLFLPPKELCCHSYIKRAYTYTCSGRFEWGGFMRANTSNEQYQNFLNEYGSYGFDIGVSTVSKSAEDELISGYRSDSCNVLLDKLEEGVTERVGEDLPPEAKQMLEDSCNGELERTASVSFFTREVDKALCGRN